MWGSLISALLSDIPSSFQYTIGDVIEPQSIGGLFKLAEATHKANKYDRVSAFVYERKSEGPSSYDEALRTIKFAKSLRHPFILSVRDVLETGSGNLYIITEHAQPLIAYLAKSDNNRYVARETLPWNLKCLKEALEFLHQADIIHRAICLETIFVSSEGQWKIGIPEMGYDLSTQSSSTSSISMLANPLKILYEDQSSPYSVQPLRAGVNTKAADLYMLGCALAVIWTLCSERKRSEPARSIGRQDAGTIFPAMNSVKWNLQSNQKYKENELLAKVIQALIENSGDQILTNSSDLLGAKNHIIPVMQFFQNYALQNSWDLEKFFESTFPKALENSKNHGAADSRVRALVYLPKLSRVLVPKDTDKLTPLPQHIQPQALRIYVKLLQDSSLLLKEVFDEIAWRTINALYHDPERATRFMLLSSIESYANHLDARQIQQIFDEVLAGLLDSSQELRDVTLRGLTVLLPKLIEADLSTAVDKALRVISGMISNDKVPSVRTNATVCLSKVALLLRSKNIHSRTTQGFKTAIADSFSPCRLAGLEGLRKILNYIPKQELAASVLPAACPRLLDEDPQCRYAAHRFVMESVEVLTNDIDLSRTPPSAQSLIVTRPPEIRLESVEPARASANYQSPALSSQSQTRESILPPADLSTRREELNRPIELETKFFTPPQIIEDYQPPKGTTQVREPLVAATKERKAASSTLADTSVQPVAASTRRPAPSQSEPTSAVKPPKPDSTEDSRPKAEFPWLEEDKVFVKRSLGAARRTNVNRNAA